MFIVNIRIFLGDKSKETAKNKKEILDFYLKSKYSDTTIQLGHNERENMYRIFIDIPLESTTTETAITKGKQVMDLFLNQDQFTEELKGLGIERLNYRLGNDEDRTPKNYFLIDDKGHAASKKSKVMLVKELDTDPV